MAGQATTAQTTHSSVVLYTFNQTYFIFFIFYLKYKTNVSQKFFTYNVVKNNVTTVYSLND